jgi:hypothetical protein
MKTALLPMSQPPGEQTIPHPQNFGGHNLYHGANAFIMRTRAPFFMV